MTMKRILGALVWLALLVGVNSSVFSRSGGWSPKDFPNPMVDPLKCGRKDVPRSQVCDPDRLLSKVSQDEIEGHINFIKDGQAAVAIVKKMDLSKTSTDIDRAAEIFTRVLHDTWGVGDKEKNDGVVLFVSVEDRVVYISTGEGSKRRVSKEVIDGIIYRMKPFLRKSDYGGALINGIIEIEMALGGKTIKGSAGRHKSSTEQFMSDYGGIFVFILFATGMFGYATWQKRKMQHLDRGRHALDSLIREVDMARAAANARSSASAGTSAGTGSGADGAGNGRAPLQDEEKVFVSSSCPICLEDFSAPEAVTADAMESATGRDSTTDPSATEIDSLLGRRGASTSATDDSEESKRDLLRNLGPSPTSAVFTAKTPPKPSNRPMALRCGHAFCRECITQHLKTDAGRRCPICRHPVHKDYDGMDSRPPAPRSGSRPGGGPSDDDGTSCRPSGTAAGTSTLESVDTSDPARVNQDPMRSSEAPSGWFQSNTRTNYGTGFGYREPEIRYRLHRMHHLYPDVMTAQLLYNMNRAVDRGSLDEIRSGLAGRSVEVQNTVTEMREASARAARASGSRGSSGFSFGGGRSSGGGGGRW